MTILLCLTTCWIFFLGNPCLASGRHIVGDETCLPITLYTSWHITCRYMLGFSSTKPTVQNSSVPFRLLTSVLLGCPRGSTPPVCSKSLYTVRGLGWLHAILRFSEQSSWRRVPFQCIATPLSSKDQLNKLIYVLAQQTLPSSKLSVQCLCYNAVVESCVTFEFSMNLTMQNTMCGIRTELKFTVRVTGKRVYLFRFIMFLFMG